jgi:hypothetical protein
MNAMLLNEFQEEERKVQRGESSPRSYHTQLRELMGSQFGCRFRGPKLPTDCLDLRSLSLVSSSVGTVSELPTGNGNLK